jgi:hypothetical protein
VAAEPAEAAPQPQPAAASEPADDILRPLGAPVAGQQVRPPGSGPSHGLSADATATSIDMSQYQGTDQSVLQPLERPEVAGASAVRDPLAARRKAARERRDRPEVPDNIRLMRATITGSVLAVALTIVRFLATSPHSVPGDFVMLIPIKGNDTIAGALLFGALAGVLLGFMLAAMLVQFKRGPMAGALVGLVLGFGALGGGLWGIVTGVVCGFANGYQAAKGMKQVINV